MLFQFINRSLLKRKRFSWLYSSLQWSNKFDKKLKLISKANVQSPINGQAQHEKEEELLRLVQVPNYTTSTKYSIRCVKARSFINILIFRTSTKFSSVWPSLNGTTATTVTLWKVSVSQEIAYFTQSRLSPDVPIFVKTSFVRYSSITQ